jgi:hypothetical protein
MLLPPVIPSIRQQHENDHYKINAQKEVFDLSLTVVKNIIRLYLFSMCALFDTVNIKARDLTKNSSFPGMFTG